MHPHPFHPQSSWPYAMFRYHRPSRILWFLLGGVAATLWLKGRDKERRGVEWCELSRHRDRALGVSQRDSGSSEPAHLGSETGEPSRLSSGWFSRKTPREPEQSEAQAEQERWKDERERITQAGAQATDVVADVSEAALDSILSTVETLRKKLAEHRDTRQKFEEERKREPEPQHRV